MVYSVVLHVWYILPFYCMSVNPFCTTNSHHLHTDYAKSDPVSLAESLSTKLTVYFSIFASIASSVSQ